MIGASTRGMSTQMPETPAPAPATQGERFAQMFMELLAACEGDPRSLQDLRAMCSHMKDAAEYSGPAEGEFGSRRPLAVFEAKAELRSYGKYL